MKNITTVDTGFDQSLKNNQLKNINYSYYKGISGDSEPTKCSFTGQRNVVTSRVHCIITVAKV